MLQQSVKIQKSRAYTLMRPYDFYPNPDPTQKQPNPSLSTSSFYKSPPAVRPHPKSLPQLQHTIQSQQRQTQQSLSKLQLALDVKGEYLAKRVQEGVEESKKIGDGLGEVEKGLGERVKGVYKSDRSKEWANQMEKTVQSIITSTRESNSKNLTRFYTEYKKLQASTQQLDTQKREQKKQRQKQWQQMIDNVGETIIEAESVIRSQRQEMQEKIMEKEKKILELEGECLEAMERERIARKQEHQHLAKLIQRIMEKLLY